MIIKGDILGQHAPHVMDILFKNTHGVVTHVKHTLTRGGVKLQPGNGAVLWQHHALVLKTLGLHVHHVHPHTHTALPTN